MKIFKFFRIKTLKKDNLNKYIFYSIGEIVLIFVGINLAIWFNNWNENNKLKVEEIKILKEIRLGLNNYLDELLYHIEQQQKAEQSTIIILRHFEKNFQYHDSLDVHFGQISYFSGTFPKKGAYESLKSQGLGLISNDSLRLKIIDLYEAQFPYLLYVQKFDEKNFEIYSEQYKTKFKNWHVFKSATPLDYNALNIDNHFKEHVRYTLSQKKVVLKIMTNAKQRIMSTTNAIDEFLRQNKFEKQK